MHFPDPCLTLYNEQLKSWGTISAANFPAAVPSLASSTAKPGLVCLFGCF